jgi:hypothetical protein
MNDSNLIQMCKMSKITCLLSDIKGHDRLIFRGERTIIKINKAKATFTERSPRHTKVGHPEATKPKPGVDIGAVKGEGLVICEII